MADVGTHVLKKGFLVKKVKNFTVSFAASIFRFENNSEYVL